MLSRLANLAYRHPRRFLALTALFVVTAGMLGGNVASSLKTGRDDINSAASESSAARKAIERATGRGADVDLVALVKTPGGVDSASGRRKIEQVADVLRADPAVASVDSILERRDPALVARNGRATYLAGSFKPVGDEAAQASAARLDARLRALGGVALGGPVLTNVQLKEQSAADLQRAELLALPILFLLSLLFFRGGIAAGLPTLVGTISIVGTSFVLRAASEVTTVSLFALNLATALGLGLAIDYSLLIVSRYREEIAVHGAGAEALRRTMNSAGRTVLFSSLTVALAMGALLAFPERFLYSMGIGGAAVALLAGATSLLALPALLAMLGTRVNGMALPRWRRASEAAAWPATAGFWYRLSRVVMRRPKLVAVASASLLLALGVPFTGVKFGGVDATVLPPERSARHVVDTIAADFPAARTAPVIVAVSAPRAAAGEVATYARRLAALPGVAAVQPPVSVGDGIWRVDVIGRDAPLTEASRTLVDSVRGAPAPFPTLVGGQAAELRDQLESIGSHLPAALALLAATTLLALFAMTGSVVLPLKALLMNLLTISAALGALVLVFQDGRLEGLLGYQSNGFLEQADMVLLFVIAFALSTDYGVFLLGRIKEYHDAGVPNDEAVALGLQRTGRLVTVAALLFSVAVGAFATSSIIFIKQVGIGIVVAVLIDATLIRGLLVPSLMALLGSRNWWAPRPLRRLHERLGVREQHEGRVPVPAPEAS